MQSRKKKKIKDKDKKHICQIIGGFMNKRNYCCIKMQEEEWYFSKSEFRDEILLNEDYSVHYMSDVKYCPWCGKELKFKDG